MSFRPYQLLALDHFARHPRCALWAGMGLGKTLTSLAFNEALLLEEGGPNLILAPKRVCREVWRQEAAKWGYAEPCVITGTAAERKRALYQHADTFILNYENIPWLMDQIGSGSWQYRAIISDESTKLKGFRLRHGGKRTALLAKRAFQSKHFIELTGTPATNGLKDLWGQMWFLDKGQRLGTTYTAFMERWFRIGYDGYSIEPLPHAFEQITKLCSDVCLAIDPADWFDLEKLIVTDVHVALPPAARKIYDTVERELFVAIRERTITAANAAAKSGKLLQIASGAVYVDPLNEDYEGPKEWRTLHDEKLDALESIIEEQAGAPLLVAYQFRSDLARLLARFPFAKTLDTDSRVDEWNAQKIPVLLVHPASAGHGLNLQLGGNAIAFFSQTWNLEHRLQVIERIGPVRQAQAGLRRPVFVYNILARDTVDEVAAARNASNKSVMDALLERMKRKLK